MKAKDRPKTGLLVLGLLLVVVPWSAASSAGPPVAFSATGNYLPGGPLWTISPGDVTAAGQSGRFVVRGRMVTGFLSGDITGPFSFTFGTNVPLTQSGQIHGTLFAGGQEAKVHATSQLALGPGLAFGLPTGPVLVAGLRLTGTFAFTDGTPGHGGIDAFFTVALDPATFHIVDVVPSGLFVFGESGFLGTTLTQVSLSGQWQQ